jgi:hypothetical protein
MSNNIIRKWGIELGVFAAIIIADIIGSAILKRTAGNSAAFYFRLGIGIGAIMIYCIIRFMVERKLKPSKPQWNNIGLRKSLGDIIFKK